MTGSALIQTVHIPIHRYWVTVVLLFTAAVSSSSARSTPDVSRPPPNDRVTGADTAVRPWLVLAADRLPQSPVLAAVAALQSPGRTMAAATARPQTMPTAAPPAINSAVIFDHPVLCLGDRVDRHAARASRQLL